MSFPSYAGYVEVPPKPSPCSAQATVPRGRKFIVLDRVEYYVESDWPSFPPGSEPSQATLTLTAPGFSFTVTLSGNVNQPRPPGGPEWVLYFQDVPGTNGPRYFYYRRITEFLDVSALTKNADLVVTALYQFTQSWAIFADFEWVLYANPRFTLTQTPRSFRPRDSRDDPAISGCSAEQPGDCYPTFTASLTGMGFDPGTWQWFGLTCPSGCWLPLLGAHSDFYLEHPKGVANWLPGNSTNGGSEADPNNPSPDYILDAGKNPGPVFSPPDQGGLHIQTAQQPKSVTVTVSSQDYGGRANLRAKISGQTQAVEADIVFPNALAPPPPTCAGDGQFASLPIDQDCNGIADSWEDQYKNTPGYSANADLDAGGPGTTPGDGFSVFDEYRGFHYVTDDWSELSPDNSKIRWTSTDPTNKDVFFWDNNGTFTQALRDILMPTTQPIAYRRVSAAQANPITQGQPAGGVNALNKNSPTVAITHGYALDFVNAPPPNGWLGWSQFYASEGQAIYINDLRIMAWSSYIDPAVFRAAAVAHEVGHVYGLCHYADVLTYQNPPPNPMSNLDFNHYALGSKSGPFLGTIPLTFGRYNTYLSTAGIISQDVLDTTQPGYDLVGNYLLDSSTDTLALYPPFPLSLYSYRDWVFNGAVASGWTMPSAVVQNDWLNAIVPTYGKILVARQYGYIMDKVLRLFQPPGANLQLKENWAWRPVSLQPLFEGDLNIMCGPACHVEPTTPCLQ